MGTAWVRRGTISLEIRRGRTDDIAVKNEPPILEMTIEGTFVENEGPPRQPSGRGRHRVGDAQQRADQDRRDDRQGLQALMPKATAVWLIEKTALTFDQIAAFTGLHALEVQAIADGEVAGGMTGLDPTTSRFLHAGVAPDGSIVFALSVDDRDIDLPTIESCLNQLIAAHDGMG